MYDLFNPEPPDPNLMRAAMLRGQSMAPQAPPSRASQIQQQQAQLAQAQQAQEAAYQPVNTAPMQQAYQQRAQAGGTQLLAALAAQQAGPEYAPFQAHYLKQSAASRAPMQMDGGTMTEQGFIADPMHAQNLNIRRADAKAANLERALQGNITAEEGERLRKDLQKTQQDFQREMQVAQRAQSAALAGQASADRRYAADLAHTDRAAAAAAKATAEPKGTEGERAAAGFLGRMGAAEKNLDTIGAGGRPGVLTKALGYTGIGGTARPYLESPSQQTYRAAQEEWVRAKLRKESGAAIPTDEMDREITANFPQPGEGDDVVAQKRQTRAQASESMKTMAAHIRSNEAAPVGAPKPGAAKRLVFNPATGNLE